MKKIKLQELIFIAVAIFIVASENVKPNLFTVWNLLPVIVFYILLKIGWPFRKDSIVKVTLVISGIALLLFPVGVHFMWLFDLAKTKTGSSTGGLIFIFISIVAFTVSFIPAIIQLVYISRLKNNSRQGY